MLLNFVIRVTGVVHKHIDAEGGQRLLAVSDVRHLPHSRTASLGRRQRSQPRRRHHHAQGSDAVQDAGATRGSARAEHYTRYRERERAEWRGADGNE